METTLNRQKKELERKARELQEREKAIKKDMTALQQWKDVLKGLSDPRMSADERQTCLTIIGKALEYGVEQRTAEAEKDVDDTPVPTQNKS